MSVCAVCYKMGLENLQNSQWRDYAIIKCDFA